jgi:nucleotide-binding universal stress UspA family protein
MPYVNWYLDAQMARIRREEEQRRAELWRAIRQANQDRRQGNSYRKILVALCGQEDDQALLCHVRALAAQMQARVALLWIVPVTDGQGMDLGLQLQAGSRGWRRKLQGEVYLAQWARRLEEEGIPVETALVVGTRSEADEIVAYAAEHSFDLIAMARDSSPWYKRLLGRCTALAVQLKATVPTLFVGKRTAPKANRTMELLGMSSL